MKHAEIDYGDGGIANIWGEFDESTVEAFFEEKANQCFGIRKSIFHVKPLLIEDAELPEPWDKFDGAATVLKHNGDVIVWNASGEKIKSEFD